MCRTETEFWKEYDIDFCVERMYTMGDIFGRNPVMEALKTNRTINKIWVVKGEQKG